MIPLPYSTFEGRTVQALKIGTSSANQRGVLLIGGVHAREWGSCEISVYFAADLLEAYQIGTGLTYGGKSFIDLGSFCAKQTITIKRSIRRCQRIIIFGKVDVRL